MFLIYYSVWEGKRSRLYSNWDLFLRKKISLNLQMNSTGYSG